MDPVTLQLIPPAALKPSPLNPRKTFDESKLAELAESFKSVGVIEPLVARRVNGHFEIVCGDRRSRAAAIAELETVPVIVKDLTDTQVLEIMVIENNQRQDVNALEEADGFARLLQTGYELDKLAERIGRSKKYIYDRVKLLDLVPPAKNLLLDGRFTPGHAILLARLKPDQQAKVLKDGLFQPEGSTLDADDDDDVDTDEPDETFRGMKARTVKELESHIAHHVRFNVKDAATAAPLEFGELAHRVEAASLKPGRGKKVISLTLEHFVNPDARDSDERTFGPRSFKFADGRPHEDGWRGKVTVAPLCEHKVLGVVVAGEKYGQAFDVCIARDKCQVHWKSEMAAREKNQKLRETGQAKQADRNEQRVEDKWKQQQQEEARRAKIQEAAEDRAIAQAVDGVKDLTPEILRVVLAQLVAGGDCDRETFKKRFGVTVGWNSRPEQFKSLSGARLAQAIVMATLMAVTSYGEADGIEAFLQPFKVDFRAIARSVEAEQAAKGKPPAAKTKPPVQTSAKPKKSRTPKKATKKKGGR